MAETGKTRKQFQSTLPTRGSDVNNFFHFYVPLMISIHAPHEGERPQRICGKPPTSLFQSTLPTRGSDQPDRLLGAPVYIFQSTLPTRGSDQAEREAIDARAAFQSTLPTRGSDALQAYLSPRDNISIHAPHEGERLYICRAYLNYFPISIHAPHEGERLKTAPFEWRGENFNPRSPRGGATIPELDALAGDDISIHAPHEGERPDFVDDLLVDGGISIHAPHEGERQIPCGLQPHGTKISIHAPHEGERQRKSAFVCSISANLLNIIHCGAVTRAVSRRRIALFRLFSVRRSGVFMYAYASH